MENKIEIFSKQKIKLSRNRVIKNIVKKNYLFDEINKRLLERLSIIKKKFPNVLEIGSRIGNTLNMFPKNSFTKNIILTDISRNMLNEAKKRIIRKNKKNIFFINLDEEKIPFKENKFDLVLSNLYLHWTNDLLSTLNNINLILKPDGLFLASIFGSDTLHELKYSIYEAENFYKNKITPRVSPFLRIQDAGMLLQKIGYQLPVIDRDVVKIYYKDLFSLMHDIKNMGESNSLIERKKNFTSKKILNLANKIYKKNFSKNNKIFATYEILYLTGWKKHKNQQKPLKPGSASKRLSEALDAKEENL